MSKMNFNIKDNLANEIADIKEYVPEPVKSGFVIQGKEDKIRGKYRNNFPLYIDKEGADMLLTIAKENNISRNDLILQMINNALSQMGRPSVKQQ